MSQKVILPSLAPFTLSDLRISYYLLPTLTPNISFHPNMKWFSASPISRHMALSTDRPNVFLRCGSRTRKFSFSIVPGHDENRGVSLVMATLMYDRFLQKCGYRHGWERADGGCWRMTENKGPAEWMVFWRGDRGVEWDVDGHVRD